MSRTLVLDEVSWTLPEWVRSIELTPANCRSCDADIRWTITTKGKRAPVNPDGTSHFATCPQADDWRRSR